MSTGQDFIGASLSTPNRPGPWRSGRASFPVLEVTQVEVKNILTRTSGYLESIASHSLQPYRGCSFGNSLCGVGCYVQHNPFITKGRKWGSFLEVRNNAAEVYLATAGRERRYAQRKELPFGIFMSSSTDPFLPQESRYGVSEAVLEAMLESPPDVLIVQTHTAAVQAYLSQLKKLHKLCQLRVHISIESDQTVPGLPPPASPVKARLAAAQLLKAAGLTVVITVAPLLPIKDPVGFFSRLSEVSNAVVLDHFVGGDGSKLGQRTLRTPLPKAMEQLRSGSCEPSYLQEMVELAREHYAGSVGVGRDGFAARYQS